jgi:hypothetical protein
MRYSPRNLRIACDHRGLTHFGGVYFFREFLQVLQFRNFLARQLTYPRRNRRYSLSQVILALVYPVGENTRRGVRAGKDGIVGVYDGLLPCAINIIGHAFCHL